jgi:hypothetical protein
MLHHPGTLSAGLLNGLKNHEVCVKYMQKDINVTKHAMFNITDWDLNQHCLDKLQ